MNELNKNIFNYTDPSLFLRDQWLFKKSKNENFSIRAWALNLGIKSHSQLHQMLYGKRTIPKKYVPNLVKNLNLNKKEADHFESLLNIQKSKTVEEKKFYFDKLKNRSEKLEIQEISDFELIKNPLNYFLLEIFQKEKKPLTPFEIKNKFFFNYSLLDIKSSILLLVNAKVLIEVTPGVYQKAKSNFFTTNDVPSQAIKEYHKNLLDLAKIAVEKQSVEKREFSSTVINIDQKDLSKAKELIREFREKFVSEMYESKSKKKTTYQLNMNFFSITNEGEL